MAKTKAAAAEGPPEKSEAAGTVALEVAAKLIMVTPRRIQQLVREGYIPAAIRGRYQTVGLVQGYIRSLQDERKSSSRNEHENRVRDARAREIELRIGERDRRLIEREEHEAIVEELVGMVREEVGSLPGQITRDAARKREIEDLVDAIFNRLADRCVKRGAELRADGDALPDDEEDDA